MSRAKAAPGVSSSSTAPNNPPTALVTPSARGVTPSSGARSARNAQVLARLPGKRATVLDAFAATEGTPTSIRAGRVTKVPPPATAFMAPASSPAPRRITKEFIP